MPRYLPLILAFTASSLPLLSLHFPKGHDWLYELVRVAEFKSALLNCQFPPFWGEDLYRGFGSPIFLFYAPLYSFVSTVCSFATGSIISGSSLALLLFTALGLFSMKLAVQEALREKTAANLAAARLAACCYLLSPYLMGDKLARNANAEYAALCILPLAIYGLLLIERRADLGALVLSGSLALTILAHNLTALVAFALMTVLAVALYLPDRTGSFRTALSSLSLALGLSAFFWLPALYYRSLVRMGDLTSGKFDFHAQFPPLPSILSGQFHSFGVFLPLLLFLLWLYRDRGNKAGERVYAVLLLAALGFLLLEMRASVLLWEHLPFMPLFQFPWRMNGPLTLTASMAAGISAGWAFRFKWRERTAIWEYVLMLVCLLNAAPALISCITVKDSDGANLDTIFERRQIALHGLRATAGDEYLPRHADPPGLAAGSQTPPPVTSLPPIPVNVVKNAGSTMLLDTMGSTPATLTFRTWFFPGWRCLVNGADKTPRADGGGLLRLSVPSGPNRVEIRLLPPPMRRTGIWISLVSTAIYCLLLLRLLGCRRIAATIARQEECPDSNPVPQ